MTDAPPAASSDKDDKTATPPAGAPPSPKVIIHPIVLLSVVDHYNRVAQNTRKRVVGILLGTGEAGGEIHVTNSFAVPFEEDLKKPIWAGI